MQFCCRANINEDRLDFKKAKYSNTETRYGFNKRRNRSKEASTQRAKSKNVRTLNGLGSITKSPLASKENSVSCFPQKNSKVRTQNQSLMQKEKSKDDYHVTSFEKYLGKNNSKNADGDNDETFEIFRCATEITNDEEHSAYRKMMLERLRVVGLTEEEYEDYIRFKKDALQLYMPKGKLKALMVVINKGDFIDNFKMSLDEYEVYEQKFRLTEEKKRLIYSKPKTSSFYYYLDSKKEKQGKQEKENVVSKGSLGNGIVSETHQSRKEVETYSNPMSGFYSRRPTFVRAEKSITRFKKGENPGYTQNLSKSNPIVRSRRAGPPVSRKQRMVSHSPVYVPKPQNATNAMHTSGFYGMIRNNPLPQQINQWQNPREVVFTSRSHSPSYTNNRGTGMFGSFGGSNANRQTTGNSITQNPPRSPIKPQQTNPFQKNYVPRFQSVKPDFKTHYIPVQRTYKTNPKTPTPNYSTAVNTPIISQINSQRKDNFQNIRQPNHCSNNPFKTPVSSFRHVQHPATTQISPKVDNRGFNRSNGQRHRSNIASPMRNNIIGSIVATPPPSNIFDSNMNSTITKAVQQRLNNLKSFKEPPKGPTLQYPYSCKMKPMEGTTDILVQGRIIDSTIYEMGAKKKEILMTPLNTNYDRSGRSMFSSSGLKDMPVYSTVKTDKFSSGKANPSIKSRSNHGGYSQSPKIEQFSPTDGSKSKSISRGYSPAHGSSKGLIPGGVMYIDEVGNFELSNTKFFSTVNSPGTTSPHVDCSEHLSVANNVEEDERDVEVEEKPTEDIVTQQFIEEEVDFGDYVKHIETDQTDMEEQEAQNEEYNDYILQKKEDFSQMGEENMVEELEKKIESMLKGNNEVYDKYHLQQLLQVNQQKVSFCKLSKESTIDQEPIEKYKSYEQHQDSIKLPEQPFKYENIEEEVTTTTVRKVILSRISEDLELEDRDSHINPSEATKESNNLLLESKAEKEKPIKYRKIEPQIMAHSFNRSFGSSRWNKGIKKQEKKHKEFDKENSNPSTNELAQESSRANNPQLMIHGSSEYPRAFNYDENVMLSKDTVDNSLYFNTEKPSYELQYNIESKQDLTLSFKGSRGKSGSSRNSNHEDNRHFGDQIFDNENSQFESRRSSGLIDNLGSQRGNGRASRR